ncbi:hypothetical protein [Algihabitans albus]|uniref:hypothetical protein n=1 Tax=Algihabitans albus TaxID=2164067 RepID=UPI000E5D8395|nr:hypothetical protein [Algihabitans albus]
MALPTQILPASLADDLASGNVERAAQLVEDFAHQSDLAALDAVLGATTQTDAAAAARNAGAAAAEQASRSQLLSEEISRYLNVAGKL